MSETQARDSQAEALTDQVLDCLAGVVRDYGAHGFDTESMDAAELDSRCSGWAEHLLLGKPAPAAGPDDADDDVAITSTPLAERQWRALRQFMFAHRVEEQSCVRANTHGMRGLVREMLDGLRDAIADDLAADEMVAGTLAMLAESVQNESLEVIRARMAQTLDTVTGLLDARRQRYESQLAHMSDHVQTLQADLATLRRLAKTDPLTQVHNRGAFDDMLAKQIDLSFVTGQSVVLLMIDLDHFKRVNDDFGHAAGDAVLKAAADALVRAFPRHADFVARYGGEEFALLLTDVDPRAVGMLGGRALKALRGLTVEHDGNAVRVTASVGAASHERTEKAAALLKRADAALYEAKDNGRDRLVVSRPAADAAAIPALPASIG